MAILRSKLESLLANWTQDIRSTQSVSSGEYLILSMKLGISEQVTYFGD